MLILTRMLIFWQSAHFKPVTDFLANWFIRRVPIVLLIADFFAMCCFFLVLILGQVLILGIMLDRESALNQKPVQLKISTTENQHNWKSELSQKSPLSPKRSKANFGPSADFGASADSGPCTDFGEYARARISTWLKISTNENQHSAKNNRWLSPKRSFTLV